MKYKKITAEKLQDAFDKCASGIIVEYDNSSIKAIRIPVSDRNHVKIAIGSYSVDAYEPEQDVKWKVSAVLHEGIAGEKLFDTEAEADKFITELEEKYQTIDNDCQIKKTEVTNYADTRLVPFDDKVFAQNNPLLEGSF